MPLAFDTGASRAVKPTAAAYGGAQIELERRFERRRAQSKWVLTLLQLFNASQYHAA
jgi:hypothetical protein